MRFPVAALIGEGKGQDAIFWRAEWPLTSAMCGDGVAAAGEVGEWRSRVGLDGGQRCWMVLCVFVFVCAGREAELVEVRLALQSFSSRRVAEVVGGTVKTAIVGGWMSAAAVGGGRRRGRAVPLCVYSVVGVVCVSVCAG
ncbi:protein smp [Striga asiatica]|uniref:Protein smp n=1 Tax=Striga asiatica TaxID=4170 RepID=A0A5A7QF97_STRAF|nr:protein smp [Striga asiatica]